MARKMNRLSTRAVEAKRQPGLYADGGGLYLQVSPGITKSWLFRFQIDRKPGYMGLGPVHTVSLAEAREKALQARKLVVEGIDPVKARDAARARLALDSARSISFAKCAEAYIKAHKAGWKNAKHTEQWTNTLETYCGPVFGALPVAGVDTALVLKVLEPIWTAKPETATRLRARIEHVLDWATVRGYREGDNPARWRGHLDKLLPRLEKRKRVKHHPALPYSEIGAFMESLRAQEGTAARALDFTILTAARTGEVIGAQWEEFDLDEALWTIPAERTKVHREHRVPLSPRAVEILKALPHEGDFVFPGWRQDQALSNMAMLELLKRMKRSDVTVHGFRSTFRDWCAERTNYPRETCEMALGHAVANEVEAAYRRGDLFDKRRRLMQEWARFCDRPARKAQVVALKERRA